MISILTQVATFASTWFEGQQKKTEAKALAEAAMENAKAEVFKRKATSDADWDMQSLANAQSSWKDEYLLLTYSLPFWMSFFGPTQEFVREGFAILSETPEWYRYSLGIMVASSFGVRSYLTFIKNK